MKKICSLIFALVLLGSVYAQQRKVTGTVVDASENTPIPGVNVLIKGTTTGTITDANGKFEISAAPEDVLMFRLLGYKTEEVLVGAQTQLSINLFPDIETLSEIIVVGYGTQIKSKVTGNIAKVGGEEIKNMPVPSVELAMQGKAAGVFIESVTGKATSATRVRIRGTTSLSGGNEPLYVIDGIPINNEALNLHGGAINPLASINFNDVESIEILKDAAAAAIYGARGANGVVLITTKKGKKGEATFEFNYQRGVSVASNRRDFMNAEEYIKFFRMAGRNADRYEMRLDNAPEEDSINYDFWQTFVEKRLKRYSGHAAILDENGNYLGSAVNTDWQDLVFQTAKNTSVDFSARGGSDKLRYFTSLGFTEQEGIVISNGFKRMSGRLNLENNAREWVDLGVNMTMSVTDLKQINADNAFANPIQAVALAPITPVRDTNGILYDRPTTTYYNPLRHSEYAHRKINEYRNITNAYANIKFNKMLTWQNEIGYDLYTLKENHKLGELTNDGQNGGYGFSNYGQLQTFVTKSLLDFKGTFGDFGVSAIAGTELLYAVRDRTWVTGERFPMDAFITLDAAGSITEGKQTLEKYSFLSYISRATLDYQEKILLSISGRIDGSSRFGKNNRYGFFPAASVGYILTKEEFLADNSTISFLKPRLSFGKTGNAEIGNYRHLGTFTSTQYNNVAGLTPYNVPNADLTWETTNQYNAGIDFGLLNNRLTGEIDYFMKKTSDLLFEVPVPGVSGYSTMLKNIAATENKGFEISLTANILTGNLKWNTNVNFSYLKNKVTNLAEQEIVDPGSSRFMNVLMLGQPIGVFYGAEYAGVDPTNGDALWYVNGPNGVDSLGNRLTTNQFDEANFVVLGSPMPDKMFSITNSFEYTVAGFKLDLSFMFQGVFGNKIHLAGDPYMAASGEWFDNQLRSQLNAWTPTNKNTNVPEARLIFANGTESRSSRYLEDGSYVKLRTVQFGITLPKSLLNQYKVNNIRLFVTGHNLLTFTKYTGWDPEVSSDAFVNNLRSGIDFYSPPQPRSLVFGVNMSF